MTAASTPSKVYRSVLARPALAAVAGGIVLALGAGAVSAAPAKIEAGTLTCNGNGTVGFIVGSKESFACTFVSAGHSRRHTYRGTINKIGIDVGFTGKSTLVWTVLASSNELAVEALDGDYAGVSADASIGVGGGAKVLVGGSQNSVVLQPLSVQGQTGLNVAVGISGLSLRHER